MKVVLADPTYKKQPALDQHLLMQADTNWWQSHGVATTVPAAKAPPSRL